jgi:hypothetical protein
LFTYRLPSEPSRHRVAVWRELRRIGAVSLQQATWAVPDRPQFLEGLERAAALVEAADGEALVFAANAADERTAVRLEERFTAEREDEWREFLSECVKFEQEIHKEIRKRKFTHAELDEEEQSLERLRRWYRDIRSRDVFHAAAAADGERALKECGERLEEYAERVYEEGESR